MSSSPIFTLPRPLLNSASPWATTLEDLAALYYNRHTGAVTTRTSLLEGFDEDPNAHQHAFFSLSPTSSSDEGKSDPASYSSINSYGYSPLPLGAYLDYLSSLVPSASAQLKPFIISIAGSTPAAIRACAGLIREFLEPTGIEAFVEINLSCPNLGGAGPLGYDMEATEMIVKEISELVRPMTEGRKEKRWWDTSRRRIVVGLKTPPYTYAGQFKAFVHVLRRSLGTVSFITATNTLGNALFLRPDSSDGWLPLIRSSSGTGHGGLAGSALHPLSLGNVSALRLELDANGLEEIAIIGVGGVSDRDGFERMRSVGAVAVGLATALGREGVGVFEKIAREDGKAEPIRGGSV